MFRFAHTSLILIVALAAFGLTSCGTTKAEEDAWEVHSSILDGVLYGWALGDELEEYALNASPGAKEREDFEAFVAQAPDIEQAEAEQMKLIHDYLKPRWGDDYPKKIKEAIESVRSDIHYIGEQVELCQRVLRENAKPQPSSGKIHFKKVKFETLDGEYDLSYEVSLSFENDADGRLASFYSSETRLKLLREAIDDVPFFHWKAIESRSSVKLAAAIKLEINKRLKGAKLSEVRISNLKR